jgi:hypothetical protein
MGLVTAHQVHVNPISASTRTFQNNPLWLASSDNEYIAAETLGKVIHTCDMPDTPKSAPSAYPSP